MQVKAITPRGYCKGVVRAIEMAKKAKDEKKPIVILGMIVHNQYIVDALKEMGIETTFVSPAATAEELRAAMPHTFFLVPGYGAQGGGAKDVAPAFDANGRGAIVNASRSILCAWQKQHAPEHDYAKAAAAEAVRMRDEIVGEIGTIK